LGFLLHSFFYFTGIAPKNTKGKGIKKNLNSSTWKCQAAQDVGGHGKPDTYT